MIGSGDRETNLVNIEVNSSPMKETVLKSVCDLIQLVRVVKAHKVLNEEVALIGFALPKLSVAGVAVEIELQYNLSLMVFDVLFKPIKCPEFSCKLKMPLRKTIRYL